MTQPFLCIDEPPTGLWPRQASTRAGMPSIPSHDEFTAPGVPRPSDPVIHVAGVACACICGCTGGASVHNGLCIFCKYGHHHEIPISPLETQ